MVGCSRSKGYMDVKEPNIKAELPDIRIRTYGTDSTHKAELADIDTHWVEFDVIFCSSTITCALDFNQPVYRVYLFPGIFTAIQRDGLQIVGRQRSVMMREIVMALPKRPKKEKGRRTHQTFFSPLPMNHDMGAVTEAEVAKIMAPRDLKVP